ncbi:unnamed protein product, partial [Rotaria sp. Silwood1]
LNLFDGKPRELFTYLKASENKNEFLKIISDEYEFINAYTQNRLDKLKIEEKIIELIIPILGIKNRAKTIEEKFETLLINIQNKSHQLKQSERIRFEYFQFLYIRFNEEMEHEKNIEYLYDKIEKMQYDLHQKMSMSYSNA